MSDDNEYLEGVDRNLRRKRGNRPKPVEEKHRECAKAVLRRGKTIGEALSACGYPPMQSRKGMYLVQRVYALKVAFQEETAKLEKERLAAPLLPNSWNAREALILQRLEKNIKAGKDGGALSAKILGTHKALSLWEPEYRSGVIILNAPPGLDLAAKANERLPDADENE